MWWLYAAVVVALLVVGLAVLDACIVPRVHRRRML